jgi:hypothetical protein
MRLLGFMKKKNVARSLNDGAAGDLTTGDFIGNFETEPKRLDSYLFNAWVNIAVGIVTRNVARADFTLVRGGERLTAGSLYELFRRPNTTCSRFDLWKETAAWWHLEGEAGRQSRLGGSGRIIREGCLMNSTFLIRAGCAMRMLPAHLF